MQEIVQKERQGKRLDQIEALENPDILSFPGEVSEEGVLRFLSEDAREDQATNQGNVAESGRRPSAAAS